MAKSPSLPKTHTSMRGVQVNMEAMRAKNEGLVAVTGRGSHLRMNARGDTLSEGGRVDKRREDIDAEYNTQLHGNAKRVDVRQVEADTFETPQQVVERLKAAQEVAKQAKVEPPLATNTKTPLADVFEESSINEVSSNQSSTTAPKERTRRLSEKDD